MIRGIAILLGCQLIGESIVFLTKPPVPGPVLGLLLLFVLLRLGRPEALRANVEQAAHGLLANLGLFFVPAGAGVVTLLPTLLAEGWQLGVVLVISAVLTLFVTVWIFLLTRSVLARKP